MAYIGELQPKDTYSPLLGIAGGVLQGIDQAKQQKNQLLLEMIKSGMYQPAATAQPQGFMDRLKQGIMGPNLASSTPNLYGMPSERVTPQMQAERTKQQIDIYRAMFGQGGTGTGTMTPNLTLKPGKGGMISPIISFKSPTARQGVLGQLGIDTEGKAIEDVRAEIQTKNPTLYGYLQKVAAGQLPIRGSFGMSYNQVSELVAGLFPDYDPTKYPGKEKTRQDFAAGKAALNIKSLNTATQHLNLLNSIVPKLQNLGFRQGNILRNWTATQIGQPQVVQFNMVKNALSGELATIFKNSGGTDIEIANISKSIDNANSPEQLKGAIQSAVSLMKGRMDALQDQWHNAGFENDFPVISSQSQRIFKNLGTGEEESKQSGQGVSARRIKVKSSSGQIGSIPSEQLQDALSQGYTQVQ